MGEKKKYANKYARAVALVKEMEQNVETVRQFAIEILNGYDDFINNEVFNASTWVRNVIKQGKNILSNYFVRVLEKNKNKGEDAKEATTEDFVQGGGIDD